MLPSIPSNAESNTLRKSCYMLSHDRKLEKKWVSCNGSTIHVFGIQSHIVLINPNHLSKQPSMLRNGSKWRDWKVKWNFLLGTITYPTFSRHFWVDDWTPGGYQVISSCPPFCCSIVCAENDHQSVSIHQTTIGPTTDATRLALMVLSYEQEKRTSCVGCHFTIFTSWSISWDLSSTWRLCACVETCFCQYRVIIEFATEPTRLTYDESVNHELV